MYFLIKSTWLVYIWKYHVDFTLNDSLVGKGAELLGHLVFSILNSLIYCHYLPVLQTLVFCVWLLFSLLVDCGAFSLSLKSESFTRINPVTLFLVILLVFCELFWSGDAEHSLTHFLLENLWWWFLSICLQDSKLVEVYFSLLLLSVLSHTFHYFSFPTPFWKKFWICCPCVSKKVFCSLLF